MYRIISASFALLSAFAIYLFLLLRRKRSALKDLPSPPMKSFLFGHLDIAAECATAFPPGIHAHNWIRYIQKRYGMGDVFYLDWWPIGPRWLFISDPELSSQYITVTQNLPKSSLEVDYLEMFLGDTNMVSVEGQMWKNLRSMFNPGFSANHLMTLVPYIVDSSTVFYHVIKDKATTNDLFELEDYGTKLTIDIIGKVVLDSDFDSQKQIHPIVETFRDRVNYMPAGTDFEQLVAPFQLIRRWKLWRNGLELNRLIGEELDRKVASRAAKDKQTNGSAKPVSSKDRKRSVIDLALDAYQKEFSPTTKPDAPMDQRFRQMAIDSMKTFIFAGHDTTASTIAYVFYLLHWHPRAHEKLVQELDSVFGQGADTQTIADQIKDDPYIVNKLEYTTAVIKETLRLFPPASTLRFHDGADKSLTLPYPDPKDPTRTIQLPLSGWHAWPIVHLISRNEKFFPEPYNFVPERFLRDQTPFPDSQLFTPAGKDAFRAFEKGPRNCIGEQLAMLETKVILAMTIRDFDFVCEFNGTPAKNPWVDDQGNIKGAGQETAVELPKQKKDWEDGKGMYAGEKKKTGKDGQWLHRSVEGHECWQILRGSAKPRGGMPGRMYLRK